MISNALHTAITALHQAIVDEQDPQSKAALGQCLQNMLKVQANQFSAAQQNPAGAAGNPMVAAAGGMRGALMTQLAGR